MKVSSTQANPLDVQTDLLCCMTTKESVDVQVLSGHDTLQKVARQAQEDLGGRFAKTVMVANPGGNPRRVLFAGLGSASKMTTDTIRHVAGTIAKEAQDLGVAQFAILCPNVADMNTNDIATQIIEGCSLGLYDFDTYRSKKADDEPDLTVVCNKDISDVIIKAGAISDGVRFVRNVANLPPNECPPSTMADIAKSMAEDQNIKCTILDTDMLKEGGFGGIMAVGNGSANPPRLIMLEYEGGQSPPVALVGKAVTFDTGGISIKPSSSMDEMKFDKCGGCAVMGIMQTAAAMKLPLNIVGMIPAVENMPGGGSYRPGDIIKLHSGKTAEILNTDAEGRLILADAISFAEEKFSPRCIIDMATLTGACIVALGHDVAGLVSDNDEMATAMSLSGERTAERVWRLPLDNDYIKMIESKVADMRNLGPPGAAGTILAAAFLKNAVKKTPWLHLDIAGTAWMKQASKKRPYNPPGATGYGVRLVIDYLSHIAPGP